MKDLTIDGRVMYEVLAPYQDRFEADLLKFTPDFTEAMRVSSENKGSEIWKITYEGYSWNRWKEEKSLE